MGLSRWLSLSVAIILIVLFVVSLFVAGGNEGITAREMVRPTASIVFLLAAALVFIWYGDELGERMNYGYISSPSPGWAVKLMGWIFLVLPAGIFIWWNFVRNRR